LNPRSSFLVCSRPICASFPQFDSGQASLLPFVLEIRMSVRLYVGNLPFSVGDYDLEELFAQAGQVNSANIVSDRETGRSRGFGFVEMDTQEGADAAIQRFNGYEMAGRAMTVNEARPRESRGGGGGFGGGRGGGRGGFGGGGGRGGGRGGFGGGDRGDRGGRGGNRY
jgi:RNA recognition motif-containing protein